MCQPCADLTPSCRVKGRFSLLSHAQAPHAPLRLLPTRMYRLQVGTNSFYSTVRRRPCLSGSGLEGIPPVSVIGLTRLDLLGPAYSGHSFICLFLGTFCCLLHLSLSIWTIACHIVGEIDRVLTCTRVYSSIFKAIYISTCPPRYISQPISDSSSKQQTSGSSFHHHHWADMMIHGKKRKKCDYSHAN